MSEMVERVAKAMWERTHDGCWEDHLDGQGISREIHLEDARAAIEAMREPTDEMISRAWGDETNRHFDDDEDLFMVAWQLMIDEALK